MIKIVMEMPESCARCFADFCGTCRILTAKGLRSGVILHPIKNEEVRILGFSFTRYPDCPLNEVKTADSAKKIKYERLREEMAKWPDWKKRAYNEMFATSTYSEKLEVKE